MRRYVCKLRYRPLEHECFDDKISGASLSELSLTPPLFPPFPSHSSVLRSCTRAILFSPAISAPILRRHFAYHCRLSVVLFWSQFRAHPLHFARFSSDTGQLFSSCQVWLGGLCNCCPTCAFLWVPLQHRLGFGSCFCTISACRVQF